MAWPEQPRYLSKPKPRVEGPLKVSGRARYTVDAAPAGVLFGAIVRAKLPAARVRAIKLEKAKAAPGIRAAIALHDGEHVVRYYGEELAALAGTSRQAVLDALPLIEVDAVPLPFVVAELDAIKPDAPRVNADRANLCEAEGKTVGDVDAAFASAAVVVEGTFTTQVEIHNPLEPHSAVVAFDGDEVIAWVSTQHVFGARESLARSLGVPQNKVRVICEHMGGGFGGKIETRPPVAICAALARAAGAPVKLVPTRFEESLAMGNRPSSFQKIRLGADRDGRLTAFELQAFGTPGYTASPTDAGGGVIGFPAPYLYEIPNTRVKMSKLATNAGSATWMRAPGHPIASFGMESILDDLAARAGIDPVEIRLRNDPQPLRRREYEIGAERFGWKEKYRAPGTSPGPVKTGIGCAGAAWAGGGGGTQAEVQINPDGTVEVRCGTQDLGTGSRTVALMVAAEMLGLDASLVTARVGDTRYPPSGVSGGSTTTASVSPAVYDACENAIAELKKISGIDEPRGARWSEACAHLGSSPLVAPGKWREGLSSSGVCGVQFAEVEVDTETGFVHVKRVLCVQDCGLVVNPLTCESQVNGGIIMGIGYALYEQRRMDPRTGVMLNPNFETYKLPGAADMPAIEVVLLNMPERGMIGVAEPVTVPTAAAIANAVANALGVRVNSLPITPDKVLAALGKVPASARAPRLDSSQALGDAFRQIAAVNVGPPRPVVPPHRGRVYA